jgi:hypothetical protein
MATLATRMGVPPARREEAAAPFSDDTPRSVAAIDSPDALLRVRAIQQAKKKEGKGKTD